MKDSTGREQKSVALAFLVIVRQLSFSPLRIT
jgi:hypothetical protein